MILNTGKTLLAFPSDYLGPAWKNNCAHRNTRFGFTLQSGEIITEWSSAGTEKGRWKEWCFRPQLGMEGTERESLRSPHLSAQGEGSWSGLMGTIKGEAGGRRGCTERCPFRRNTNPARAAQEITHFQVRAKEKALVVVSITVETSKTKACYFLKQIGLDKIVTLQWRNKVHENHAV